MKKIALLLLPVAFLLGCSQSESVKVYEKETEEPLALIDEPSTTSDDSNSVEITPELTVVPNGEPTETYKEIETSLNTASFDGMYYLKAINQEIERLQKEGKVFWHDSEKLSKNREEMHKLQTQMECLDDERKCLVEELTSMPKFLPPAFKTGDCLNDDSTLEEGQISSGDTPCKISEPAVPKEFLNTIEGLSEVYAGPDGNYYIVGTMNGDDQHGIYKNEEEIFSAKMYFSPDGVTEEAVMVLGSPAFTFNSDQSLKNGNQVFYTKDIFYKDETLNAKYNLESTSHLFAYKEKLGLVGQKEGKFFLIFNGQNVSDDFDKITTTACCMNFAYPIEVDEKGILFFMAQRDDKYYFVEVDLNKYL